ncbi:hypothetical protein R4J09_14210 [Brachyspira intermedia]|uniref:hypothetical protein n=1 Tax=Brachyspira intermedia TaxID=84377 RepID=UPI0030058A3E
MTICKIDKIDNNIVLYARDKNTDKNYFYFVFIDNNIANMENIINDNKENYILEDNNDTLKLTNIINNDVIVFKNFQNINNLAIQHVKNSDIFKKHIEDINKSIKGITIKL